MRWALNSKSDSLIQQRLIAAGLDGLYEMLPRLIGTRLGDRFVLRELYAVGGQSILWLTDDLNQPTRPAITRLALLPYHRPAYIQIIEIQRARARIEREAKILEQFAQTSLPQFYGLFYAPNPLHPPERGPEVTDHEPFLVMEYINGVSLANWGRQKPTIRVVSAVALETARAFYQLCLQLRVKHYLYVDLNPRNVMVIDRLGHRVIRFVDAGSIIPDTPVPIAVPFSWDYIPPEYYQAYHQGKTLWPNDRFVLYTLGKTLWQLLTLRQPMPGNHPDLQEPSLKWYPETLVDLVANLIIGNYSDLETFGKALLSYCNEDSS